MAEHTQLAHDVTGTERIEAAVASLGSPNENGPIDRTNDAKVFLLKFDWNASDKTQIYANVQNAANTRPPDTGGQNANNTLYDVIGRMYRIGVRFSN